MWHLFFTLQLKTEQMFETIVVNVSTPLSLYFVELLFDLNFSIQSLIWSLLECQILTSQHSALKHVWGWEDSSCSPPSSAPPYTGFLSSLVLDFEQHNFLSMKSFWCWFQSLFGLSVIRYNEIFLHLKVSITDRCAALDRRAKQKFFISWDSLTKKTIFPLCLQDNVMNLHPKN